MNYITFTMPKPSASVACWIEFFTEVMQVDPTAPMHILMAHCKFVYNLQITLPPTPHQDVYQDVGIVMSADDERSANEAAIQSGIYAKGVAQLVDSANTENPYFNECVTVLDAILDAFSGDAFGVDGDVLSKIRALFDGDRKRLQETEDHPLPACDDKQGWDSYFESAMANDPCASTSILSYFLQEANAYEYRVFCPLGDNEYCTVGALMREHEAVLEAAIQTGLMVGAVHTYFGAALDVIENWSMMEGGVRFLLESEKLSVFVSGQNRFLAKSLLHAFPDGIEYERDEAQWYEIKRRLRDELSKNNPRGY